MSPPTTSTTSVAAPAKAIEGMTLYLKEDPNSRRWIPISAIKTWEEFRKVASAAFNDFEGVISYHSDTIINAKNIWEHLLVPNSTFGISFYRPIEVTIRFAGNYMTEELWLPSVQPSLPVSTVRRMIYMHMACEDRPELVDNITMDHHGSYMLDGCPISEYLESGKDCLVVDVLEDN